MEYDFLNCDYWYHGSATEINRFALMESGMPIILCDFKKFDMSLLTHYMQPNYYGRNFSRYVTYVVYEINGSFLIVYKRARQLPKGIECDYDNLELWQKRARSILNTKHKNVDEETRETMVTSFLNEFIEEEKKRIDK